MHNNTILIIGATGGIGGAVAQRFSEKGWHVYAPVRNLAKPEAQALLRLHKMNVFLGNTEDASDAQRIIRELRNGDIYPTIVFHAAGLFLWDDGFPDERLLAHPEAVETFLFGANYATKKNIDDALIQLMPEQVKNMRIDLISSHAPTFAVDDPRRTGKYTQEKYIRAMTKVEEHGKSLIGTFGEVNLWHTPLIDTSMTRKAFVKERAPDVDWSIAIPPKQYATELYPDLFFDEFKRNAA